MEGNNIVPVMDLNHNNNDMWGNNGGWFMWLFIIFALMWGWGGNGWGNNNRSAGADVAATFANGSMTRDQLADQFGMNDIKNGIRGVQNGLCDGFYAQNTTMLNGFNGQTVNSLQGFNGIQRDMTAGFAAISSGLAENRFAQQSCCCDTNRNIDAVRAENYRNTCAIQNTIQAEGQATRALINNNTMQDLRDRLADRDRDLQSAQFQLSQQAQSANLVAALRPFPQPAYITCSPYQAANSVYGYQCSGA